MEYICWISDFKVSVAFVMGSVVWFLGMCRLLDQNKRNIVVMVVICIIYCMLAHRQLINGFQIINNKMAEALNQSMDLGFYYYISVTLEHSRRDSVLAVLFLCWWQELCLEY